MKISYNWLKEYLNADIEIDRLTTILTDIGLEVANVEQYESIKGSLGGLVVGLVKTKEKHPNADKLSITTVNIDADEDLQIVCGASNVAAGQKVVVATVGTILYDGNESFKIKKSKIRGELSQGMICSEKEIGVGTNDSGIMALPPDVKIGTLAKDYFDVERDVVIEIDLTPNRIDAASHVGVARDVAAYLKQTEMVGYTLPSVESFKVNNTDNPIQVTVKDSQLCPRYAGVTIFNVKVKPSPTWLQNRLKAIGLNPINNIVDATNYVLLELGQPLHAFDADKIEGGEIIVKTLPKDSLFITLDGEERKLHTDDLMICNSKEPMCIAGVLGGIKSGVTNITQNIFLESAYFNSVSVRKTAKRHGLNTDASYRFERGVDPNITLYALKRAALLIQEIAGGEISSEIVDMYPQPTPHFEVVLRYDTVNRLLGNTIKKDTIKNILVALEIEIIQETDEKLQLSIPPYRVDVQREVDVIEEILRIYGYNNIKYTTFLKSTLQYSATIDDNQLKNNVGNMLASRGFNEIMTNSLTTKNYYDNKKLFPEEGLVNILNPLSLELNILRQTLLFNGLEAIAYNINHQNTNLKLYEFGKTYHLRKIDSSNSVRNYTEQQYLSLLLTGTNISKHWQASKQQQDPFFDIKVRFESLFNYLNVNVEEIDKKVFSNDIFSLGLNYTTKDNVTIAEIGYVQNTILEKFDIKTEVSWANIYWDRLLENINPNGVKYKPISKYPEVTRDLALLIDKHTTFAEVEKIAYETEKKLLKKVTLFDVYEGNKIEEGKKSYAINFVLQDVNKTLTEKQINKVMEQFIANYKKQLNAEIR